MNLLFTLLAVVIVVAIACALLVRAIGGRLTVIEDWKKAWKFYSMWALVFIGMLPDLWNSMIASGIAFSGDEVPGAFSWTIKSVVAGAFALRFVKQAGKPPEPPDFDGDGKPG